MFPSLNQPMLFLHVCCWLPGRCRARRLPLIPLFREMQRRLLVLSHMSGVLHPSPQYMPSSPVTNLAASFRRFQVLQQPFYTVEPRTPISSVMLHQCWPSSGIIASFGQLAVLCLMHPKMCFAPWLPSTVLLTLSLLSLIPPCPSLLSCSAATYLPVCSLVWHCSIPCAGPSVYPCWISLPWWLPNAPDPTEV